MRTSPLRPLVLAAVCLLATACTGGVPASSDDGAGSGGATTLKYLIEEPEDAEALTAVRDGQVKLANEQVRYQIAFREDLARLAQELKRPR